MSGTPRRICVVTGSRAEYGLLYWLLKEIQADPDLILQLVVTGTHLSPRFGRTVEAIEADGFVVDAAVENLLDSDTPLAVTKSMALATVGIGEAYARLKPDVVVVLGDRYEMLAAAQATLIANLPLAHIHGGETTEGAFDEAIRHSITKMAHLHFVTAAEHQRRVCQLGENPQRVFNVGAPGLDHVARTPLLSRQELEADLGFSLAAPLFLVTYHPVTLDEGDPADAVDEMLAALDRFPEARIVFTGVNADTRCAGVHERVQAFVERNRERVLYRMSYGQLRYMSLLKEADVVLGNSSSAIIEAPALNTATVNIGDRQKGRLRADSIIDVPEERTQIEAAIRRALGPDFQEVVRTVESKFGKGDASRAMVKILKTHPLNGLLKKRFFDQ